MSIFLVMMILDDLYFFLDRMSPLITNHCCGPILGGQFTLWLKEIFGRAKQMQDKAGPELCS